MLIKADNFTDSEIKNMRRAGQVIASLWRDFAGVIQAGMTGTETDAWFAREIKKRGARASYLDPDPDFPGVICISVNDTVVHGVPNPTPFAKGDLVSLDLVVDVNGMKADSAYTYCVDEAPTGVKKMLLHETQRSLYAGIDAIKYHGGHGAEYVQVGDISKAVEKVLDRAGLGIVRDLVGHGIGREMHQEPDIPNYFDRRMNDRVPIENAIAVEPMATLGSYRVVQDPNGWDIRTADGSWAAHFEHTILLTPDGPEIITKI
ncbi:MAG: type I methionyl aminopeptidase [Candidatus Nanoperiomorbaceae bacterium]